MTAVVAGAEEVLATVDAVDLVVEEAVEEMVSAADAEVNLAEGVIEAVEVADEVEAKSMCR